MAKLKLTPSDHFNQRRSKSKPFVPKESLSQTQLFDWARWAQSRYPDLALMFAVPNGVPLHGPQRYAIINWLKAQGLRPGVPDIALPIARGGYFSKFIEMKTEDGELSGAQQVWIAALRRAGASVSVCRNFEEAVADLEVYFGLPPTVAQPPD